jgi:GNAT superfamily N-acetyltransferase
LIQIRKAHLPDDKAAILSFIDGLQRHEAAFEANRRLDAAFAEEYFAELVKDAANGQMFVAESDGRPIGWVLVHEREGPVFVKDDERRYAYIAELFVEASVRGQGVGQALIAACEAWAKARGYATIQIGYIAGNARAGRVYVEAGYAPYATQLRKRL